MISTRLPMVTLASLLIAGTAHAAWKGKGEAGVVLARGNTTADTVNLKLGMSTEADRWKHALEMAALRATSQNPATGVKSTSADRYLVGWQSDYKINARSFAFGGLRYEKDKFSGFDYQASLSTGIGYRFYDSDKIKLSGQAGFGYRRTSNSVTGATTGNGIVVAGMDYENLITATTRIVDRFRAESGAANTLLTNFMGVEVKMSDRLALAAGLDVRQNTKPPTGKKKTDTITTLNLVYPF